jgi:hypothetical protein
MIITEVGTQAAGHYMALFLQIERETASLLELLTLKK